MRKLLFAFLLLSASPAFANDTLTRAQTYDFSVGDTFDYCYYHRRVTFNPNPNPEDIISISYGRYVITNTYYSLDSATGYIARERLYPLPVIFDTLTITHLSIYDLATFTPTCISNMPIITNSQYHNRVVNIIIPVESCTGPDQVKFVFADGLGTVLDYRWSTAIFGGENYWDSTALIYYAKGSETWGIPYSDFTTGMQPLSPVNEHIALFPTLNDGTFNMKVNDVDLLPVNLAIYDILGNEVKQLTLNNLNNIVNIEPYGSGMYLWKAITKGQLIETGKMVVH